MIDRDNMRIERNSRRELQFFSFSTVLFKANAARDSGMNFDATAFVFGLISLPDLDQMSQQALSPCCPEMTKYFSSLVVAQIQIW